MFENIKRRRGNVKRVLLWAIQYRREQIDMAVGRLL